MRQALFAAALTISVNGAPTMTCQAPATYTALMQAKTLACTATMAAPSVSSITPVAGPLAGGTAVTLTGAAFIGATGVTFGAVPASSFTVNSATQITAMSPAEIAGAVSVTVTTPQGTSP